MDLFDAAYQSRLQAYKKKVINRYLNYVMVRSGLYTKIRAEKRHIAFRVFASVYTSLGDFGDDKCIINVLDLTIDKYGIGLGIYRPVYCCNYNVADMVLLFLWASRKVLGRNLNLYPFDMCQN